MTKELKLAESNHVCNCSVPCMRVYYEPSLSYAQLSSNNIERLIGSDRKEALKVSEQENDDPNLQVKWMFSFHLNAAESQCSDIYLF